jgi:hypothetical protein
MQSVIPPVSNKPGSSIQGASAACIARCGSPAAATSRAWRRAGSPSSDPEAALEAVKAPSGEKEMALPFERMALVFKDIDYYVPLPGGQRGQELQLLKKCWGAFRPGECSIKPCDRWQWWEQVGKGTQ